MVSSPAQHFRDMADRIERNDVTEFGGAVLVVPPSGGDPIAILLVDPKRDLAHFWSTATAKITIAAREFEENARNNMPFRR